MPVIGRQTTQTVRNSRAAQSNDPVAAHPPCVFVPRLSNLASTRRLCVHSPSSSMIVAALVLVSRYVVSLHGYGRSHGLLSSLVGIGTARGTTAATAMVLAIHVLVLTALPPVCNTNTSRAVNPSLTVRHLQ
ncbi:hypothetical protein D9619_009629 [Psilocybe cf. subviscida]|uniref:Uncharacterized protein n=1 Tax=Psilocybe cf. subviscida TaxID=2480587 RepID=A0A8H5BKP5_9AGAR|nr:hypothetical protein D9619_009629 [Psilocybe cf. subviscida]